MFTKAFKILSILSEYGEAYVVGGCVRDYLLGLTPNDIDITTNVSESIITSLFESFDIGKNKSFGVSCIKFEGETFEIAQFRKDGKYSDGRRPDSIELTSSVIEDLSRRDFTINSLAMDKDYKIIDPFNGKADLFDRVLRCVGDAETRLSEDYLRILRGIRFAEKYALTFEVSRRLINELAPNISKLSIERIDQEMMKMASLSNGKFGRCIKVMEEYGVLKYVYPEIDEMKNFEHNFIHHPEGNCFKHVISALTSYYGSNALTNFAILFHDIGKTKTYIYREDKGHTYYSHDSVGADMITDLAKKYKWDSEREKVISFCCREHMKFHNISTLKNSTLYRMMEDLDMWLVLRAVAKADAYSRGFELGDIDEEKVRTKLNSFDLLSCRILDKKISGEMVMELRGLKPGKDVGLIKQRTIDFCLNHPNVTDERIKKYILDFKI
jgi:tRNA nucleotidyltransferase (CCA-adding enzyme)